MGSPFSKAGLESPHNWGKTAAAAYILNPAGGVVHSALPPTVFDGGKRLFQIFYFHTRK
jgi:hypothetical protein